MCDPVTLTVLTVASTAASLYGQQQAADAQEQANQRQYQNTMQAYRANVNQTNLEQSQEREASMQKIEANNIQARAAESRSVVAAGESGISGLSVDAIMGDIGQKQGRYNNSVATNFERAEGAINNQRQNVYANAASTINGLKTPQQPDYLGAGLKIAGAGYDFKQRGGKIPGFS